MMWVPKEQAEKWKELSEERKLEFIEKAKNADFAFVALIETMYESPNFENYTAEQKQFIKDFIEARKK